MRHKRGSIVSAALCFGVVAIFAPTTPALGDGTEQLGDPSIDIASGSAVLCAGTGLGGPITGLRNIAAALAGTQAGTIDITVPEGVAIQQVLLYWEGHESTARGQGDTDTITLDPGGDVTGQRIGGPTQWRSQAIWDSTYRADITNLGIIENGANSIEVSGTDFNVANNGAGLVVIVDDGVNTANIQVKDGNDVAFLNFPAPLDTTAPVTYIFPPANESRTARLCMFFGSVALEDPTGGFGRPTIIEVNVEGVITQFIDQLANDDGPEWDSFEAEVEVPANAISLTVQALSADSGVGPFAGNLPASFSWLTSTLALLEEEEGACCIGFDCQVTTEGDCEDQGGVFFGPGTECSETEEACCFDDGSCLVMDPLCCEASGGTAQGPGSTCEPNPCEGACCFDFDCMVTTEDDCEDLGGVFLGPGTVCADTEEACCFPDDSCVVMDPVCCDLIGGTPQGPDTVCDPNPCVDDVGAGTPGYWKNHPDAWPVDEITVGDQTFSRDDAINQIMKHNGDNEADKTITLAKHLIATKLNLLIGTDPSCISLTVEMADAFLVTYPVFSNLPASSPAWYDPGEPIKDMLDMYNNGMLCAPSRDYFD